MNYNDAFAEAREFALYLNPRQAKLLNTYTNKYNSQNRDYLEYNLYDDDSYKHDEEEIDYRHVLLDKIEFLPPDYKDYVEKKNITVFMPLELKYQKACELIYEIADILESPDVEDLNDASEYLVSLTHDFIKNVDDFRNNVVTEGFVTSESQETTEQELSSQITETPEETETETSEFQESQIVYETTTDYDYYDSQNNWRNTDSYTSSTFSTQTLSEHETYSEHETCEDASLEEY